MAYSKLPYLKGDSIMQRKRFLSRLLTLSAFTALMLSVSGCSESKYTSGSSSIEPTVTEATDTALKKTVDDFMKTAEGVKVPGAIIGVKMNGYQPWYYATGSSEIDVTTNTQKSAMKADMPFRLASVSKMFVAQAVIQLAEEGKIDLNKSVEYYLPGSLSGINETNKDKITVRMLLNHTSGIYSYLTSDGGLVNGADPNMELPMNSFVKSLGLSDWPHDYNDLSGNKILKFVNTYNPPTSIKVPVFNNISSIGSPYGTNPYFAAGNGFHYSNTNYYLLGFLIEKVTGKTVESEIERLITKPLGLTDSYLATTNTFTNPSHVHGYTDYFTGALLNFHLNSDKSAWVTGDGILEDFTDINPSFGWTSASMISSAKDLIKFLQFIMETRVTTGQESSEWIVGTPLPGSEKFLYGRGLVEVGLPNGGGLIFGHGGQFAGYNVAAYWYSDLDIYLVIMTNNYSYDENGPNDILATTLQGADGLYKRVGSSVPKIDPNSAIFNGILGVLAKDPNVAKSVKKSVSTSFRLPDMGSMMR